MASDIFSSMFSSAGIILIRLTGIFSASKPHAWQHPDLLLIFYQNLTAQRKRRSFDIITAL
jgi:hypothetical protein